MKAALLVGPGEIRIEQRPGRPPTADEVEIAVAFVGICGSDQARFAGRGASGGPVVFGHELSGRIETIGSGVRGFAPGQAVAVAPLFNCGICPACLAGNEHLCPQRVIFGTQVDGGLQEWLCLPACRAIPLPSTLSLREGALIEPAAIAVHAVELAGPLEGRDVAVFGAGAIGLLIGQVARARGASRILMVDPDRDRLRLAASLGFPRPTPTASILSPPCSRRRAAKGWPLPSRHAGTRRPGASSPPSWPPGD